MTLNVKPVLKYGSQPIVDTALSKCLMTISVGQEVHEQEKFATTVELVNKTFQSCIMLIDDSLQRHSMAINSPSLAENFYDASILAGDAWLKRNKMAYTKFDIPLKIIRWDRWLFHEKFPFWRDKIIASIEEEKSYQEAFITTINEFLQRFFRRAENSKINTRRAEKLCMNYLIEECTAMCLWPELNCNFEVYPSKRNSAMALTHEKFVIPNYPDLLHSIHIKFKNRKQLIHQNFSVAADNYHLNETL